MIDFKPYGAFIEHTIRPLLEELELVTKKLKIRNFDATYIAKEFIKLHIKATAIEAIKTIICTAIIGYVAWTIAQLSSRP